MLTTLREPLKPRTKEEYAYDVLRTAILRCELEPGEKLVLDNLSEKMGVSPIPLRGALQRLQSEGLVEIKPHTGAIVSELLPADIEQVSLLLERLENLSFEVAAHKVTDADIVRLHKLVEEMASALAAEDSERWSELNVEFHRSIAHITSMKLLVEFTNRALDNWTRLRRWYLQQIILQLPLALAEHRQMVELLALRDTSGLAELVIQHNQRVRDECRQVIAQLSHP